MLEYQYMLCSLFNYIKQTLLKCVGIYGSLTLQNLVQK